MGGKCSYHYANPTPIHVSHDLNHTVLLLFLSTEHTNGDGDYTSSLLGILVMQDVHLGLLVALLPALAGRKNVASAKANSGAVHGILSGHDNANDSGTKYLTYGPLQAQVTERVLEPGYLLLSI